MKNLLLVSGGNDSIYIYNKYKNKKFICIYFDYGQPYKKEEIKRLPPHTKIIKIERLKFEKKGFVKGRNLMFLIEIVKRYDNVVVWMGSNKNDIFPDNNESYLKETKNLLNIGFKSNIKIHLPLKDKTKQQIMKYINKYKLNTYSCYKGKKELCGVCKACLSVKNAIKNS